MASSELIHLKDILGDIGSSYYVSDDGKLYSLKQIDFQSIKLTSSENGYLSCVLSSRDEGHRKVYIHRLVALAFVPKADNSYKYVQHIDGDKSNNCSTNLLWCKTRPNGNYQSSKDGRPVVCVETNVRYSSMYECGKQVGVSTTRIRQAVHSKCSVKGNHYVLLADESL